MSYKIGSVSSARIENDAVGTSELADDAVDTGAILDAAVTAAKLEANLNYNSDLTVQNLTVNGTQTILDSTSLEIKDKDIKLGRGNTGSEVVTGTGFILDGGTGADVKFVYDASNDRMDLIDSNDSYVALKAGSIDANATTASALATARTIALAGDLSGSASFDGSANISISATVDGISSYGATLVDDADAAAARTTLGLGSAATSATSDFFAASDVSTFGATLIDDADASAARTTLGLGSAATSASGDFFAASGVSTFGATLVDDADAASARTTMGVAIGSDVQAFSSQLSSIANLSSPSSGDVMVTMNPGGFSNNVAFGDFSNASSGVVRESVGSDDSASSSVSISTFTYVTKVEMNNRNSVTITLPTITASDTGKKMIIKAGTTVSSSKPCTVQGNSQNIDGGSVTLNEAYQALTVVALSSGSGYEWSII